MKRLLYILLYMMLVATASAQVKVTGRVIDLQNKPVSDVIVKVVNGSKTLALRQQDAGVHQHECEGRVCAGIEECAEW